MSHSAIQRFTVWFTVQFTLLYFQFIAQLLEVINDFLFVRYHRTIKHKNVGYLTRGKFAMLICERFTVGEEILKC